MNTTNMIINNNTIIHTHVLTLFITHATTANNINKTNRTLILLPTLTFVPQPQHDHSTTTKTIESGPYKGRQN